MKSISIVIVDDHQVVRQGLRSFLDPDPRFDVIGEASTGLDALKIADQQRPNIMIVDLKLPDMAGTELCQRILKCSPETRVMILTAFFKPDLVNTCLLAGAKGYLIKDAEKLNLPEQLIAIYEGHTVLDPRATDVITDYLSRRDQHANTLSLREIDVIRLVSQGFTNRQVGTQLHLTENTVKGYIKEIFSKLNARNRIEAVSIARKRGIL
jgi:two-component system NarL family response regulator